jgi:hypothetical protein
MALSHYLIERIDDAPRLRALTRRSLSRKGGVRCLTAALAVVAAIASMTDAAAQDPAAKAKSTVTPLPPARPANIGGDSVIAGVPPLPATTPTIPQAPPQAQTVAQTPTSQQTSRDIALAPGATGPLPTASRQRMHACGLEWQTIKMTGHAIDKTWRDFAEICLSR